VWQQVTSILQSEMQGNRGETSGSVKDNTECDAGMEFHPKKITRGASTVGMTAGIIVCSQET